MRVAIKRHAARVGVQPFVDGGGGLSVIPPII